MHHHELRPTAVAVIRGGDTAPSVFGAVTFYQYARCVAVVADIDGLPPSKTGFYGFHIHGGTTCGGTDFSESQGHYNPQNTPHPRHAGDLPPLMRCGSRARMEAWTDRFSVADILGRTVIIHSDPDDFRSQPSGDAGTKIACGVIEPTR